MNDTSLLRVAFVASILVYACPGSAQVTDDLATPAPGHHADYGWVGTGASVLSVAWGLGAIGAFGALDNHTPGEDPMFGFGGDLVASLGWDGAYAVSLIPVAGPILSGIVALDEPRANLVLGTLAFVGAGAQLLGLTMLIVGLLGVDEPSPGWGEGVRVLPMASADRVGLLVRAEL